MPRTTEKQGCLSVLFPFLRVKQSSAPENFPYRLRDDFLSPAELSFYRVLSTVIGNHFIIQSKVRLADIFFVSRPNENFTYFNKISQRHVDFLICDPTNMKPVLGIELDDASHRTKSRQQRDEFVEKVFQVAGLPLLRFPVQRAYNTKAIGGQIALILKKRKTALSGTQQAVLETMNAPKTDVPLCLKCGIPMVLRTVKQGEHKGKQFYGCVNYPRCREVRPVPKRKVG